MQQGGYRFCFSNSSCYHELIIYDSEDLPMLNGLVVLARKSSHQNFPLHLHFMQDCVKFKFFQSPPPEGLCFIWTHSAIWKVIFVREVSALQISSTLYHRQCFTEQKICWLIVFKCAENSLHSSNSSLWQMGLWHQIRSTGILGGRRQQKTTYAFGNISNENLSQQFGKQSHS